MTALVTSPTRDELAAVDVAVDAFMAAQAAVPVDARETLTGDKFAGPVGEPAAAQQV